MSNEQKSMQLAEKLVREMNGIPAADPWYYPPESNNRVLLFTLDGKDCNASFPLARLEDYKEFEAWVCKRTLQAAIEKCRAPDKS